MKKIISGLCAIALAFTLSACGNDNTPARQPDTHTKTDTMARTLAAHKTSSANVSEAKARKHRRAVKAAEIARQRARQQARQQVQRSQSADPLAACRAAHGGSDEMCNDADPRIPGTTAYERQQYELRKKAAHDGTYGHKAASCPAGQHPVGTTGACA